MNAAEIEAALTDPPTDLDELRSLHRAAWSLEVTNSHRLHLINTVDSLYIPALEAALAGTPEARRPQVGDRIKQEGEETPGTVREVQIDTLIKVVWDDANSDVGEWLDLDDFTDLGLTVLSGEGDPR